MSQSLAEKLAAQLVGVPPARRPSVITKVLGELTDDQLTAILSDWHFWARPEQLPPEVAWSIWGVITGRGFGKTKLGANWTIDESTGPTPLRGALVQRTTGDLRDIMVEGNTGILAEADLRKVAAKYEPSKRRVSFANGSVWTCFSAEEPDMLRGPEVDRGWGDEFSVWKLIRGIDGATAYDNLLFASRGTRAGRPRTLLTCTPKRVPTVKDLETRAARAGSGVVVTRGSMYDNIGNLDPDYVAMITERYAGTALGDQELLGKLAKTVEGAIFTETIFDESRITNLDDLPELTTPVVSVDPSVGDGSADECGICVTTLSAGLIPTEFRHPGGLSVIRNVRHGYVLEDASFGGDPDAWAKRVSKVAEAHNTFTVVAEKNQGGLMVKSVLHAANPSLRVKLVSASKGKEARAQPTAALFSQRRWHLVGHFPELEDQCTTWVPGQGDSPDRLDGMVWGQAYFESKLGGMGSTHTMPDMSRRITG